MCSVRLREWITQSVMGHHVRMVYRRLRGSVPPFLTEHHGDERSCPGGLRVADQEADRKHHGHLLSCLQALTWTSKGWTRNCVESNSGLHPFVESNHGSLPWALILTPVCRPTSVSEGLFVARQGHGGVEAEELTLP